MKICWLILSRNIKELPEWSFYKYDSTEFNKLCYTESDTGTFQRVDEVLQKITEIEKRKQIFSKCIKQFFNTYS